MHMSKDDQEARILAQISELQKKGTALRLEEEAELNQHDRNKIKGHKIIYTGVYLLAVFTVTGFVDGLLSFFTDLDTLPYWHVGLTALVAVSFGLFYFRFMKQVEVCVQAGKKKVIRGIVTRKYTKHVNEDYMWWRLTPFRCFCNRPVTTNINREMGLKCISCRCAIPCIYTMPD